MIGILILIIGFLIGFGTGVYFTIKKAVDIAVNFFDLNVNYPMFYDAIFKYNNHINACYNGNHTFPSVI